MRHAWRKQIERRSGQVAKVPGRVVEIAVVVAVALQVIGLEIVEAAHADQPVEEIRPAEQRVGGVKRAEAGARRRDAHRVIAADMADVGDDLFLDVVRVERLATGLLRHWHLRVHPTQAVDAVDREHPNASRHDGGLNRLDEEEALVLQEVRGGRREQEQGPAAMTVGDDRHRQIERGTVPAVETTGYGLIEIGEWPSAWAESYTGIAVALEAAARARCRSLGLGVRAMRRPACITIEPRPMSATAPLSNTTSTGRGRSRPECEAGRRRRQQAIDGGHPEGVTVNAAYRTGALQDGLAARNSQPVEGGAGEREAGAIERDRDAANGGVAPAR